ncbi:MAG: glycosyltransferase family 9 protein [Prevotellaceae bacterium]|nr:glycosyltransferase family 9 protein [Prevotellaceae bacterium]
MEQKEKPLESGFRNIMKEKNILVIRLSAMGDVAMTVPTIASVVEKYPNTHITMLTNERFAPLFATLPRVEVFGINPKNYDGLWGLFRLFGELKKLKKWYAVVDLHNVIRSKVLRMLFSLSGIKCIAVEKDRAGRRELTARRHKHLKPLRTVQRQYMRTFSAAGFHLHEQAFSLFPSENKAPANVKKGKWLGIAPFASYEGKIYPENQMETVIKKLSEKENLSIFLFGNGEKETAVLKRWEETYPNVKSVAGKMSLGEELQFMSWLDAMLTMDSANMHLASLVNIPVISIWGQTHPYAGFFGNGQAENHPVQVGLPCRPCSVYGNKKCYLGTLDCMKKITPEMVIEKIESVITI